MGIGRQNDLNSLLRSAHEGRIDDFGATPTHAKCLANDEKTTMF